jgi:hypothetical protein
MTPLGIFLIRLFAISAGTGVALLFRVDRELVVRIYLLVAGGLALEALVRTAIGLESRHRRAGRPRRQRDRAERPETLARLEDQVALAGATAADLHFRLRPVLCGIAEERAAVRGAPLDEQTAGEAWDLIRPDRKPPADSFAKGVSYSRLAQVVDALERI